MIKGFSVKAKSLRNTATYQKLWKGSVADPGERPGPSSPLFFDRNEAQRAEKKFFGDRPPRYLGVWMTGPPLSEGYLDPPLKGSIYPPLVPWWGVWFCVYVRELSGSLKLVQGSGWFCMRLHFFIKASFIIDTKGLYCVTRGNISFSSLLFCFWSAAFLLWVLLLIAIFLSKLSGQPLSINRFLKSEILPYRILKASCLSTPF